MAINGGGSARGGTTTLTGLTDTPAGYGVNGQVLTTNGVGASTWATPSAAYALDPTDWVSLAGVEGVGTGTALTVANYPDLNTADGAQALAGLAQFGSVALRATATVNNFTWQGIELAELANTADGAVACRVRMSLLGIQHDTTRSWGVGIAIYDGTNTAANNNRLAGVAGTSTPNGSGTFFRTSTAGRGTTIPAIQTYGWTKGAGAIDLAVTRDGTTGDVLMAVKDADGQWLEIGRNAAWATGAVKVALMLRSFTAGLSVVADVTHIGTFATASLPQVS